MTEIVLPQHANAIGTIFGGTVMAWVDICGAICAQRHCGGVAVTAAVDDLVFVAPLRVGDVARLTGRINAAFRSSVEVEVRLEREDKFTMERSLCVEARMTFVAVDEHGKPMAVAPLSIEDEEGRARESAAKQRREERLLKRR